VDIRRIAVLGSILVVAAALMAPAGAHVGGTVDHLWGSHLKSKVTNLVYTKTQANSRFARKTETVTIAGNLAPGKTITGIFGASSGASTQYGTSALEFEPRLAEALPDANAHYLTTASPFTADCPAINQAAPGHLCVYEGGNQSMAFVGFYDPFGPNPGISRDGTILYLNTATSGHVRGSWAVTAPTATSAAAPSPNETRLHPAGGGSIEPRRRG
jgi:hypothetical protein